MAKLGTPGAHRAAAVAASLHDVQAGAGAPGVAMVMIESAHPSCVPLLPSQHINFPD